MFGRIVADFSAGNEPNVPTGGRAFATARAHSGLDSALRTIAETAVDPVAADDLVEAVTFLIRRVS